jgi:hypothetical protein
MLGTANVRYSQCYVMSKLGTVKLKFLVTNKVNGKLFLHFSVPHPCLLHSTTVGAALCHHGKCYALANLIKLI